MSRMHRANNYVSLIINSQSVEMQEVAEQKLTVLWDVTTCRLVTSY